MVQPQVQEPPEDTASDQTTVIEDSTQPEQLQREAALAEGRNPDAEMVAPPTETPATPAPEPTPPAATQVSPPAEAPAAPQPRVYSQQEHDEALKQWQRRAAGAQRQAEEVRRQLAAVDLEAQVEAHIRSEEARLTPAMGEQEARAFARSPERQKLARDHYAAQRRLQEVAHEQTQRDEELESRSKVIFARDLAREHNIALEDQELLLAVATPVEMEKVAKRLGRAKAERAKETAAIKAQVPAETKTTSLESGMSGTSAPESEDTRLSRLQTVPSWEWSDDDIRFMRRQQ